MPKRHHKLSAKKFLVEQRKQEKAQRKLEEIFLHSRCHPDAGTWVAYHRSGPLSIECAECREPICRIIL